MKDDNSNLVEDLPLDNEINSGVKCESLNFLEKRLKQQLIYLGFKYLTNIQHIAFNKLSDNTGHNAFIKAQIGTGKTLAYLIPLINRLVSYEEDKRNILIHDKILEKDDVKTVIIPRHSGARIIIIVPTRELADQIEKVTKKVANTHYWITVGTLLSGTSRSNEKKALKKGITILITTPGRLLDHLENSVNFNCKYLQGIALDEIDRLLDLGFGPKLTSIIDKLKQLTYNNIDSSIKSNTNYALTENSSDMNVIQKSINNNNKSNEIIASIPVKNSEKNEDCNNSSQESNVIDDNYEKFEIPQKLQIIMISATLTEHVIKLAKNYIDDKSYWIVDEQQNNNRHNNIITDKREISEDQLDATTDRNTWVVPKNLKQGAIIFHSIKYKTIVLIGLLLIREKKEGSKTIVFTDTCETADYLYNLISFLKWPKAPTNKKSSETSNSKQDIRTLDKVRREIDENLEDILYNENYHDVEIKDEELSEVPVFTRLKAYRLHGKMLSIDRQGTLNNFNKPSNSAKIIFASDVVSRGINFTSVDYVIQFEMPIDISDYVHRIGRTARLNKEGYSTIFLAKHEKSVLDIIKKKTNIENISLSTEENILKIFKPQNKPQYLPDHLLGLNSKDTYNYIQAKLSKAIKRETKLLNLAIKAYLATLKNYKCYPKYLHKYFNYNQLHTGKLASSFFILQTPKEIGVYNESNVNLNESISNQIKYRSTKYSKANAESNDRQDSDDNGQSIKKYHSNNDGKYNNKKNVNIVSRKRPLTAKTNYLNKLKKKIKVIK